MIGDVPISVFIFAVFIIPMAIEGISFARLNEWSTRIGLRTVWLRGRLPKQTNVDIIALQDLGFRVRAFSDRRIFIRSLTPVEERAREGKMTLLPRMDALIDHMAVLTLGRTHWTLEVFMPWLFWTFVLTMLGYLAAIVDSGGILDVIVVGLFFFMLVLVINTYWSGRKAYRKVVELIEWGT